MEKEFLYWLERIHMIPAVEQEQLIILIIVMIMGISQGVLPSVEIQL